MSFRLHPGERRTVAFGRMASHQHFVKVPHCEPCNVVILPVLSVFQLICLFWRAVCKVQYVMRHLFEAAEVGGIVGIVTATFADSES